MKLRRMGYPDFWDGEREAGGNRECGESQQDNGDSGGSMQDGVVDGVVGGVVEEEVVLKAGSGGESHLDLHVAALVGGGKDVEGGETEAEERSGGGGYG